MNKQDRIKELEARLESAFKNDKSHVQKLLENEN